eukprot:11517-Heterococcus_DN1.PRE.2
MFVTREQDRSAADKSNPLLDVGLLQIVLSYVGPGHCLFVAPVSKWWNEIYAALPSRQLKVYNVFNQEIKSIICAPQMTLYSSVFSSPSRVMLAHKSGLDCTSVPYQRAAGKYAGILTLAAAHDLGMQYTATTMAFAAQCNNLAAVQQLHSEGCPWPLQLLTKALSSGYFELVRWCYEHGCSWAAAYAAYSAAESGNIELMAWVLQQSGTELNADVMMVAASKGHLLMCQYLHTCQCPWDTSSTTQAAHLGHVDVLRWLVDNGCPWSAMGLCWHAAYGGSVKMLAHLQELGFLTSMVVLRDLLMTATTYAKYDAAQWLREQGAELPE